MDCGLMWPLGISVILEAADSPLAQHWWQAIRAVQGDCETVGGKLERFLHWKAIVTKDKITE